MKLLFVTGEFPPMRGSVGDHTARLASALAARGHRVGVLTDARAAGAHVPDVELFPVMAGWGMRHWGTLARAARGWDVVHLQYQAGAFGMGVAPQWMADWLRLVLGTRVVTTFHDLLVPYLFPKAGPLRQRAVRHLARASDGVVATNADDGATLSRWGVRTLREIPIASPLPLRLPEGWDRAAWRARWGVGPEQRLIVHFGFLNRAKGVETLLRAYDALLRAGQPYRLLMAGDPLGASDPTNQAYHAEIQALADELTLHEPWLQWTGDLSEEALVAAVCGADLIVLPFREGASLRRSTLVMALSLGMPVVTTQPQHPIALLRDGENVVFAPRDDPPELARRIALLLRYEPSRQRVARGAAALRATFDWERLAEAYEELYGQLL